MTIIKDGTTEIEYDGKKMTVIIDGVKRAWLLSNGVWQKPYGGVIAASKIPANVVELTDKATQIVKEAFAGKKAEMFPNYESLEYHQKLSVKYDVLEALGYMSTEDANTERRGINAAHGKVQSEAEAEKFDNQ